MKLDRRKLLRLAATGAAGCALANAVHAQTVLTGTGLANNTVVPADHGSFAVGTPNIALTWDPAWDAYNGWPNDPGGGVYQHDNNVIGQGGSPHTIVFTPDPGFNVVLESLDMNDWVGGSANGGTAGYEVEWTITGSSSGVLASGTHTTVDASVNTLDFGEVPGVGSEELTLSLAQITGSASYLAIDNLAFDQVASTDPSISDFTSDTDYIASPVTLSWSIANPAPGLVLTLDDGSGPIDVTTSTNLVTGDGSLEVAPTATTTYTLALGGANSRELTVLVGEALSLTASPNLATGPAYETTLSWEIRPVDAGMVTLFDGTTTLDVTADTDPLTGLGSRTVTVSDPSMTFEVDANNSGSTVQTRVFREQENSAAFSIDSASITTDGTLTVSWTGAAAGDADWVGIYRVGDTPGVEFSTTWNYLNGTQTAGPGPVDGSLQFSGLGPGEYFVALLLDDGYEFAQGPVLFEVTLPPLDEEIIPVTSVVRSGDELTITWESKAGFEYDIYASDSLEGDPPFDWEVLRIGYPTEGDGTTRYTEDLSTLPGGVPARRFYRIYDFDISVP